MAWENYFTCENKDLDLLSVARQTVVTDGTDVAFNIRLVGDGATLANYEAVATAGQTVFNLGWPHNDRPLLVFVDGVEQPATSYTRTGAAQITFLVGLFAGQNLRVIRL